MVITNCILPYPFSFIPYTTPPLSPLIALHEHTLDTCWYLRILHSHKGCGHGGAPWHQNLCADAIAQRLPGIMLCTVGTVDFLNYSIPVGGDGIKVERIIGRERLRIQKGRNFKIVIDSLDQDNR